MNPQSESSTFYLQHPQTGQIAFYEVTERACRVGVLEADNWTEGSYMRGGVTMARESYKSRRGQGWEPLTITQLWEMRMSEHGALAGDVC